MTSEKRRLAFEGVGHALVNVEIPLQMAHDADEAQI
jgi:hypothetical protein